MFDMSIKFLKHAIIYNGKRIPVRYSKGGYTKQSRLSEGTITIYAKSYNDNLPNELEPKNESNSQTDYFEKDKARITPDSPYYNDVLKAMK